MSLYKCKTLSVSVRLFFFFFETQHTMIALVITILVSGKCSYCIGNGTNTDLINQIWYRP